jgi:hypothetical protein
VWVVVQCEKYSIDFSYGKRRDLSSHSLDWSIIRTDWYVTFGFLKKDLPFEIITSRLNHKRFTKFSDTVTSFRHPTEMARNSRRGSVIFPPLNEYIKCVQQSVLNSISVGYTFKNIGQMVR